MAGVRRASTIAGLGEAAKLDVTMGPPLSGALNSTSICRVDVEPVRVRIRTLLCSPTGSSGSSDEVGVNSGDVGVAVEEPAVTSMERVSRWSWDSGLFCRPEDWKAEEGCEW